MHLSESSPDIPRWEEGTARRIKQIDKKVSANNITIARAPPQTDGYTRMCPKSIPMQSLQETSRDVCGKYGVLFFFPTLLIPCDVVCTASLVITRGVNCIVFAEVHCSQARKLDIVSLAAGPLATLVARNSEVAVYSLV